MVAENHEQKQKKLRQLLRVGQHALGLSEESYRDMLEDQTGKRHASAMSLRELERCLGALKAGGFRVQSRRRPPGLEPRVGYASDTQCALMKRYWYFAARDRSYAAFGHFAKRITGADNPRFLLARGATTIILALRPMVAAAGYNPDNLPTAALDTMPGWPVGADGGWL